MFLSMCALQHFGKPLITNIQAHIAEIQRKYNSIWVCVCSKEAFFQRVKMIFRLANCIVSKRPNWLLWLAGRLSSPIGGSVREAQVGIQQCATIFNSAVTCNTHTLTPVAVTAAAAISAETHYPFIFCYFCSFSTFILCSLPFASSSLSFNSAHPHPLSCDRSYMRVHYVCSSAGNCLFVVVAENRISRAD